MAKFLTIPTTDNGSPLGAHFVNLETVRYAVYESHSNSLTLRFDKDDSFIVPESAKSQVLELIRASSIPIAV